MINYLNNKYKLDKKYFLIRKLLKLKKILNYILRGLGGFILLYTTCKNPIIYESVLVIFLNSLELILVFINSLLNLKLQASNFNCIFIKFWAAIIKKISDEIEKRTNSLDNVLNLFKSNKFLGYNNDLFNNIK